MAELKDQLQQTLGSGYRVIKELGGGGMSRVFAAEETELERPVVIKVLPPDLGAGLNVERFRREIQLAAKLQHPHIVPLLSAGAKDGLLYYTMPHIDGDTLRVKLSRSGEMPVPEAIRVLRDVADALEYAHEHGVVHRDIKPENVLLSGHHGLVTDFGVSKALANSTGQQSLTSMGVALGTPTYMSPEQATADPNVDHRTDIYALGVLGYELMAGRPPFSGNTPQQVLAAQVTELPVDVRKHRANMPGALATLIMRCLEKKPADRYQSAHEVRLQLESMATPSGGTLPYQAAVPMSQKISVGRGTSTKAIAYAIAAMALAAIVVLGRNLLVGSGDIPFSTGAAHQITNNAGIEITPALSPDGKLLAYAGGSPWVTRIYVRQVAGGEPVEVASSLPGNQRAPTWSPDGSQLLFVTEDGIHVVPALGGAPRLIVRGLDVNGPVGLTSPVFSHDGKFIAFTRLPGKVSVSDADGQNERTIVDGLGAPHSVTWSPDDSRLAYVVNNSGYVYSRTAFANISPTSIWTIGLSGGKAAPVTDAVHLHFSPAWTADGRGLLFVSSEHGGRDIYYQALSSDGEKKGKPSRLTTGLNVHGISLSGDGGRLAYSTLSANVGIWSIPIPSRTVSVGGAHAITSSNERIENPVVSPDGKWIAFDSDRNGTTHIYRISSSGGAVEQLTSGSADDFFSHWSPDATKISYHTWVNGQRDSYITPVSGFAPKLVMGGGSSQEHAGLWAPDGEHLIVPSNRTGRYELYLVSVLGGSPVQITTQGGPSTVSLSPDGQYGVFVSSQHLLNKVSLKDGATSIVTSSPIADSTGFTGAVWGKSGDIYVRITDRFGNRHIAAIRADGSSPRVLVHFDKPDMPAYRGEFSTDNRNFYFTVGKHEADIWVMDLIKK